MAGNWDPDTLKNLAKNRIGTSQPKASAPKPKVRNPITPGNAAKSKEAVAARNSTDTSNPFTPTPVTPSEKRGATSTSISPSKGGVTKSVINRTYDDNFRTTKTKNVKDLPGGRRMWGNVGVPGAKNPDGTPYKGMNYGGTGKKPV